jgi:hypothetical protein
MDGQPEGVSIGKMRIRASRASGFSVDVIESKSSRRSAVRSSAWLEELRGGALDVMNRFPSLLLGQHVAPR